MQGRPVPQGVWKSGNLFEYFIFEVLYVWEWGYIHEKANVLYPNSFPCWEKRKHSWNVIYLTSFLHTVFWYKKDQLFIYLNRNMIVLQKWIYLCNQPEWENKGWQKWEQFPRADSRGAGSAVNLYFFDLWNLFPHMDYKCRLAWSSVNLYFFDVCNTFVK